MLFAGTEFCVHLPISENECDYFIELLGYLFDICKVKH